MTDRHDPLLMRVACNLYTPQVCQDWGGLIGLRLVAEHSHRFRRVVVANTGLPIGYHAMPDAFVKWREFSQRVEELPVGMILQVGLH
jgi:haloalkane dehalogenase